MYKLSHVGLYLGVGFVRFYLFIYLFIIIIILNLCLNCHLYVGCCFLNYFFNCYCLIKLGPYEIDAF